MADPSRCWVKSSNDLLDVSTMTEQNAPADCHFRTEVYVYRVLSEVNTAKLDGRPVFPFVKPVITHPKRGLFVESPGRAVFFVRAFTTDNVSRLIDRRRCSAENQSSTVIEYIRRIRTQTSVSIIALKLHWNRKVKCVRSHVKSRKNYKSVLFGKRVKVAKQNRLYCSITRIIIYYRLMMFRVTLVFMKNHFIVVVSYLISFV